MFADAVMLYRNVMHVRLPLVDELVPFIEAAPPLDGETMGELAGGEAKVASKGEIALETAAGSVGACGAGAAKAPRVNDARTMVAAAIMREGMARGLWGFGERVVGSEKESNDSEVDESRTARRPQRASMTLDCPPRG